MKIYITARFSTSNQQEVEALCLAVRSAGMEDFSFIRDVENYQKIFENPKELWARSRIELKKCDGLLIDVSDQPSGGRVVEAGMAYALEMPIFVIKHTDTNYKEVYDGIATKIISYTSYEDVSKALVDYRTHPPTHK